MERAEQFKEAMHSYADAAKVEMLRAEKAEALVDDLVVLVRRLSQSLRKAAPDSALPEQALDYLLRHGLGGQILRGTNTI